MTYIIVALICGVAGALTMAIFAANSYQKGYEDGRKNTFIG